MSRLKPVFDYVIRETEDTISFLQALLRVPTVMNACTAEEQKAALELCLARLRPLGFTAEIWRSESGKYHAAALYRPERPTHPGITLNGHLDVVPAGDLGEWSHSPFAADRANGRVYGRGASDQKSGIVAMIRALEALFAAGYRPGGRVVVQLVMDEEHGDVGTKEAIDKGYAAEACLVTEPTGNRFVMAECGIEHFRVEIRTKAGHSAARYKAVHAGGGGGAPNAIEKGALILKAMQDLERHWAVTKSHPLLPPGANTINPGLFVAGPGGGREGELIIPVRDNHPASNADYCSLEFEAVYLPGEQQADVRRELADHIERVSATDPWLSTRPPEITWNLRGLSGPTVVLDEGDPFTAALKEACRVAGHPFVPAGNIGTSDVIWLNQAGAAGTVFGPGDLLEAHMTDESVSEAELITAAKVIAAVTGIWTGAKGGGLARERRGEPPKTGDSGMHCLGH